MLTEDCRRSAIYTVHMTGCKDLSAQHRENGETELWDSDADWVSLAFIFYFAKGDKVFTFHFVCWFDAWFVCLSVCLCNNKITQTVADKFL